MASLSNNQLKTLGTTRSEVNLLRNQFQAIGQGSGNNNNGSSVYSDVSLVSGNNTPTPMGMGMAMGADVLGGDDYMGSVSPRSRSSSVFSNVSSVRSGTSSQFTPRKPLRPRTSLSNNSNLNTEYSSLLNQRRMARNLASVKGQSLARVNAAANNAALNANITRRLNEKRSARNTLATALNMHTMVGTSPDVAQALHQKLLKLAVPAEVMDMDYSKRESFATIYYDRRRNLFKAFFMVGTEPHVIESKDCDDLVTKMRESEYIRGRIVKVCGPPRPGTTLKDHVDKCSPPVMNEYTASLAEANTREAAGKARLAQLAKEAAASKAAFTRKRAAAMDPAAIEAKEFAMTNSIIKKIAAAARNATGRRSIGRKILADELPKIVSNRGFPDYAKQERVKRRVNYYISTGKTMKARSLANEQRERNVLNVANATRRQQEVKSSENKKVKENDAVAQRVIRTLKTSYRTNEARRRVAKNVLNVALATVQNETRRNRIRQRVMNYLNPPQQQKGPGFFSKLFSRGT